MSRTTQFSESTSSALLKSVMKAASLDSFDIFLSHSYLDKELVYGIVEFLEDMGYLVYVDWKNDSQLNRENVTKETAQLVRKRITQSKSLLFATTEGAKDSKWMPWELGYMDGKKARSAILPVARRNVQTDMYVGQEYLGIYPYIVEGNDPNHINRLWVHENEKTYVWFDEWLNGSEPQRRAII